LAQNSQPRSTIIFDALQESLICTNCTSISEELWVVLLQSPHLSVVRELRLTHCNLGDNAVIALVKNPYLRKPKKLDLSFNSFQEQATKAILEESVGLQNLIELQLDNTDAAILQRGNHFNHRPKPALF